MSRYDMARSRPDDFQTNPWALDVLIPHLNPEWRIWECAAGNGNLVNSFRERGFECDGSDLHYHGTTPESGIQAGVDFLKHQGMNPLHEYDAIVTNPPYTLKDAFIARCYDLGKPFALLLPLTAMEGQVRQRLYARHGLDLVFLPKRPEFETPSGKNSGSWFCAAWFCGFMGISRQLTFNPPDAFGRTGGASALRARHRSSRDSRQSSAVNRSLFCHE